MEIAEMVWKKTKYGMQTAVVYPSSVTTAGVVPTRSRPILFHLVKDAANIIIINTSQQQQPKTEQHNRNPRIKTNCARGGSLRCFFVER